MAHPELRRGAGGADVEALQNLLNRVGAILDPDGDFGRGTERAVREAQAAAGQPETGVADAALWGWLEAQPDPSPDIPTEAVAFIAREEVGGRAYYDAHVARPHFPGGESGITIGVGYDLRFRAAEFEADWGDVLTAEARAALRPHLGQPGSREGAAALAAIVVPFASAWRVFVARTLPDYVALTDRAFAGAAALPPLCRGTLVSLVYNRGAGMDGDSRREMRAIRDDIAAGRLPPVADALLAMRRLWSPDSGLYRRRAREAAMWRRGLAAAADAGPPVA